MDEEYLKEDSRWSNLRLYAKISDRCPTYSCYATGLLSPDDYVTKAVTVPSVIESNSVCGVSAFATLIIYFVRSDN
jgi:hypothetical protein